MATAAHIRAGMERDDWTGLPTFAEVAAQRDAQRDYDTDADGNPTPGSAGYRAWRAAIESGTRYDDSADDDIMPCGCCSGSCYCDDDTDAYGCVRCGTMLSDDAPDTLCATCASVAPFVVVAVNGGEDGTLWGVAPASDTDAHDGGMVYRDYAVSEADAANRAAGTVDAARDAQARYDAQRAADNAADAAEARVVRLKLAQSMPNVFTSGMIPTDDDIARAAREATQARERANALRGRPPHVARASAVARMREALRTANPRPTCCPRCGRDFPVVASPCDVCGTGA